LLERRDVASCALQQQQKRSHAAAGPELYTASAVKKFGKLDADKRREMLLQLLKHKSERARDAAAAGAQQQYRQEQQQQNQEQYQLGKKRNA